MKAVDELPVAIAIGDHIRFPPGFLKLWCVEEVVERGVVVDLPDSHNPHRHLVEWFLLMQCRIERQTGELKVVS